MASCEGPGHTDGLQAGGVMAGVRPLPLLFLDHRSILTGGACCWALWCPGEPRHWSPVLAFSYHHTTFTSKIKFCNLSKKLCDLSSCSGFSWGTIQSQ